MEKKSSYTFLLVLLIVLTFAIQPMAKEGDIIVNEYESVNYNGYFIVEDELKLLDFKDNLGLTYQLEYNPSLRAYFMEIEPLSLSNNSNFTLNGEYFIYDDFNGYYGYVTLLTISYSYSQDRFQFSYYDYANNYIDDFSLDYIFFIIYGVSNFEEAE